MKITWKQGGSLLTATDSTPAFALEKRKQGNRYQVFLTAKEEITLVAAELTLSFDYAGAEGIFVNGYQSWTDSREYAPGESLKSLDRLPKKLVETFAFAQYGDSFFKKYRPHVLHGYDISYIRGPREWFIFSGNTENAYLIVNHRVRENGITLESDVAHLTLPAGTRFPLFDYYLFDSIEEGKAALRAAHPAPDAKPLLGYTSWYNHYQDISAGKIETALAGTAGVYDLFQIDDGYETFVGDWLDVDEKKFPQGLAPIVEKIHEAGMTAGLWLAPFAAEEKSRLYREHKDWLAKNPDGSFVKCGSNWSGFYALDFYNPAVQDYLRTCLTRYMDMGFDFFKLDFLYASSVPVHPGKTRAMVAHESYAFLRETLGEKKILGCGACVTSSMGLFDYLRIGPDLSLQFDDVWYMRLMHRERISTKVTLQNTIYRSFLNGCGFWNDPDVFLLRDTNIGLTPATREAVLTINALFGRLLLTSDDIGGYDKAQKSKLTRALALRRATDVWYRREGKCIAFGCTLDGEGQTYLYDTRKGVFCNGTV